MKNSTAPFALLLFSLLPYSTVAWGYMKLVDGDANDFWIAFACLFLARIFFSIIESMGSAIAWNTYGKKLTVSNFLAVLKDSKFSRPPGGADDLEAFLADIVDDNDAEFPERMTAKEFQVVLRAFPQFGLLAGMRFESAAQEAFLQYKEWARAHAS